MYYKYIIYVYIYKEDIYIGKIYIYIYICIYISIYLYVYICTYIQCIYIGNYFTTHP